MARTRVAPATPAAPAARTAGALATLVLCVAAGASATRAQPPAALPAPSAPPARHGAESAADSTASALRTIIEDMTLPGEGRAHGVPLSYNWALRPHVGLGNTPGRFAALTAWGQVYEAAEGNPARNTRVQLKDMAAYVLSRRDGRWRRVQYARSPEGGAYVEDFKGDAHKPADVREAPEGISVTAGGGFNFHFWPKDRAAIDPGDVAGVFTTVRARLVAADPGGPDDRGRARYLLNVGGDYWLDLAARWDNFKSSGEIAMGRFKYVRRDWQSFNMTTLDAEALRRNPPPLE